MGELWDALGDESSQIVMFFISFVVIGIMWLNHHTIFSHLGHIDRGLFYLNLALLMTIVFLPYPTGVFGEALRRGVGARTAAVFYTAVMAINALLWVCLWLYASVGRRLLRPEFPESQRAAATLLFIAGAFVYTASIGVAFINPTLCLAVQGGLAVYYAFDPISRRTAHERAGPT